MKLLFCGSCFDIRALEPKGAWTECRCANARARWLDPECGTVEVDANDRSRVRIIGMNNRVLEAAFYSPNMSDQDWREMHDVATNAAGYIFHKLYRACWACVLKVGQTGDVSWHEEKKV